MLRNGFSDYPRFCFFKLNRYTVNDENICGTANNIIFSAHDIYYILWRSFAFLYTSV